MKETHTHLGIRDLDRELEEPGHPELKKLGWTARIRQFGQHITTQLTNPEKGTIRQVVVRTLSQAGKTLTWDQPVIEENPGIVFAPIRRIKSGKGHIQDKVIVYLIITQRPIVKPRLNLPTTHLVSSTVMPQGIGITSVEFPRGIGEKTNTLFRLAEGHRMERIGLIGDQTAFEAAGGFEELEQEAPQLILHPGAQPMRIAGLCPNTSLFSTIQGGFIIPVSPDQRDIEAQAASADSELIKGIIPLVYPDETDKLLEESEHLVKLGIWSSQTPIIVDDFTMSMLAQIGRLLRQNRIPVTG